MLIILKLLTPMLALFFAGMICKRKNWLSQEVIDGMKKLVSGLFLPFLAFRAFSNMQMVPTTFMASGIEFIMQLAALGIGFLTVRFIRGAEYKKYHPFLITTCETGMFGYAVFEMMYGTENFGYLAACDMAIAGFFFVIYLPLLVKAAGEEGQKLSFGKVFLSSPPLWGCLAGLVCTVSGLSDILYAGEVGLAVQEVLSVMASPVTPLILIVIGYGFSIEKSVLKPVLTSSVIRILTMGVLSVLGVILMDLTGLSHPMYKVTLVFIAMLPANFMLPVYAKGEEGQKYVNTHLSVYILLTFVMIAVLRALT